ncbi:hypothetical protein [Brucella lupini]|uniref:Uncharacterized protein n=1 Tax=Brucella lupini TaxID=255457 RepID=A0A256GFW5_9HYPH|nr:hypothetical protein [Brucella lupini]OYR26013.1 hypothetical protein CES86_4067 [Brucella lupini]
MSRGSAAGGKSQFQHYLAGSFSNRQHKADSHFSASLVGSFWTLTGIYV